MVLDGPSSDNGGLYDGYDAYRTPTDDDYRRVLSSGLIAPDANVFLNLYRFNDRTRSDLFAVLQGLGDQLWVPRQVIEEFWRNRESVLKDPRDTGKTIATLNEKRKDVVGVIRTWGNRVGLTSGRINRLADGLSRAYDTVCAEVGELAYSDAKRFAGDTNKDPVLTSLEQVVHSRVGPPLDELEYEKALQEAKRRAEKQLPPGYKDSAKRVPAAASGDYLVWVQILKEAKKRRQDVLLITGDVKEDWWRREQGELRGPRPELVEEMRSVAGVRLFMMRPETLLIHASRLLQFEVQKESARDIERAAQTGYPTRSQGGLVLTRKPGERLVIDDEIVIEVAGVVRNNVRIRIMASEGHSVFREEIGRRDGDD